MARGLSCRRGRDRSPGSCRCSPRWPDELHRAGQADRALGVRAHQRVRRLERRGVVKGYAALFDPAGSGLPLTAFISIKPFDPAAPDDAPERLAHRRDRGLPQRGGDENYILKVRVGSPFELEDLLQQIRAAAGVSTRTTIVLSTPYENRPLELDSRADESPARRVRIPRRRRIRPDRRAGCGRGRRPSSSTDISRSPWSGWSGACRREGQRVRHPEHVDRVNVGSRTCAGSLRLGQQPAGRVPDHDAARRGHLGSCPWPRRQRAGQAPLGRRRAPSAPAASAPALAPAAAPSS